MALKAAEVNYSSVCLHTREFGITYNLFDPPTVSTGVQPNWRTGATYYPMLVLAELLSNETSVVVDLNPLNSRTNTSATVAAYGIYDGPARARGKLVLLNFDYPRAARGEGAPDSAQRFVLPAGLADAVGVRLLAAPNVSERTDIAWAGQTVQANGELAPEGQVTQMVACAGGCEIDVPGPGLAVVWLNPETPGGAMFVGSSTLDPLPAEKDDGGGNPGNGTSRTSQPSSASHSFGGFYFWNTVSLGMLVVLSLVLL